ncbi:hypothetical protein MYX77_01635 [Acidobacteriia bacterium AH_259_A11_L15]|nr:hypothetical protein [Acidobacteriia bacterium AH_259_A11_L15]
MQNVDWPNLWSQIWHVLNSPIVIAVLGGILATWLTARWQLRSKRYELQLKAYERLQGLFLEWLDAVTSEPPNTRGAAPLRLELVFVASLFRKEARAKITDLIEGMGDFKVLERPMKIEEQKDLVEKYLQAMNAMLVELGGKGLAS